MHIDGKMITRLNPTSSASKTKNLSNQASEQSSASIGQASDYALNQSGLDQKLRQNNDQLTQLLSRQNVLEKGAEKLNNTHTGNHSENNSENIVSEASSEIRESGLFTGTSFEQHLNKLLTSEKPLVESIKQSIKAELKELSVSIAEKVEQTQAERLDADQLVHNFRATLNENPHALNLAHSTINPQIVHGLLGSGSN